MPIERNSVVTFNYVLSNINGDVLESNTEAEPALYLHGHGNIMPSLEIALEGKSEGDELEVTLEPKDAYGEKQSNKQQRVPIKHLLNPPKHLRPGLTVQINTQSGPKPATIIKAGKFNVDLDTNHPLAGLTLCFKISIVNVREASADEIAHGHAHGPGGHQH
ncbi:MAG TPA: peptidylprolyl isomerase [Halieaceae bacterium]|nr:peptidylprolyl isomerase [Halieaceae bacterium]